MPPSLEKTIPNYIDYKPQKIKDKEKIHQKDIRILNG